ncbi:MAG: DEAD/DEAH box helicase [Anaerolineaceae bacterium]|nr:DEAD/DEAH box helicase [Anaerolineaceae bacterium]
MPFNNLGLIEPLLQAVRSEGYTTPTTIQEQAIPPILGGKDLLGCAQTGTGKTAAFALPILQHLHRRAAADRRRQRPIRALIMAPTRELAAQIGESFQVYGRHAGLRHTVIFGGVKQGPQDRALRRGVDILVATPGRLLDLLNQRLLSLAQVEILVLDEADRMLDMGFIHDIRRVIAQAPARRQTLLFSATMPREIQTLADSLLSRPVKIRVTPESPAASTVQQSVYFVESHQKATLLEHLLGNAAVTRALVFTRTKRGADRVARRLNRRRIAAEAIHSNKSQNARMRALLNFKSGRTRVLAASDIAARGLDVDDISHVINYDMPRDPETYVHRIGRTGRAGASGEAISLCSDNQRSDLRGIERLLGRDIPVLPAGITLPQAAPQGTQPQKRAGSRRKRSAAAARNVKTPPASRQSGSPEQKKNNFWRSKRKPSRLTATPPGSSGRRSHRERGR